MVAKLFFLIVGGALGTLARSFLSEFISFAYKTHFPLATLFINLLESFIIGFLWGIFDGKALPHTKAFAFVGFLGAFTTFSTFSLDCFKLLQEGEVKLALFNILANNIFGIILVFVGYTAAKMYNPLTR